MVNNTDHDEALKLARDVIDAVHSTRQEIDDARVSIDFEERERVPVLHALALRHERNAELLARALIEACERTSISDESRLEVERLVAQAHPKLSLYLRYDGSIVEAGAGDEPRDADVELFERAPGIIEALLAENRTLATDLDTARRERDEARADLATEQTEGADREAALVKERDEARRDLFALKVDYEVAAGMCERNHAKREARREVATRRIRARLDAACRNAAMADPDGNEIEHCNHAIVEIAHELGNALAAAESEESK